MGLLKDDDTMSIDGTSVVKSSMIGPGGHIMGPKPQVMMAMDLKRGQKITINQGESLYVFVPQTMGSSQDIVGLNKKSPFTIEKNAKVPEGVPVPRGAGKARTMGSWLRIQAKYDGKVGAKDQLFYSMQAVTAPPRPAAKRIPFTLTVGPMRYYMAGQ